MNKAKAFKVVQNSLPFIVFSGVFFTFKKRKNGLEPLITILLIGLS